MRLNVNPLLDAIDHYIAKADSDLEEQLSAEGFAAAASAVKAAGEIEDEVGDALGTHADDFLKKLSDASGLAAFIENVWPDIRDSAELEKALKEIFQKEFEWLMNQCVFDWMISQDPVLAGVDDRITKPAEDFIRGWSGELARLMHLSTNRQIENILLKAQEQGQTISEVETAIAESGIRQYGYRSRRVAVTEVLRVESYSHIESMRQNAACYKKRWIHTDEAKEPRENHIAIHGQEVFKREPFTLPGADGNTYRPQCPRDTGLPASESVNCHCRMEAIQDELILGMTEEERKALREEAMDEIDAIYEERLSKFEAEHGNDPDATWEVYNSYFSDL